MKVAVVDINGKETGRTIALDKAVFGVEPNEHALYLDVKQYLAHQRQGTHKAKERAEITGSTRKIKKQKGTGTARAGSIKNPLFRGGGRVFGPCTEKDPVDKFQLCFSNKFPYTSYILNSAVLGYKAPWLRAIKSILLNPSLSGTCNSKNVFFKGITRSSLLTHALIAKTVHV